MNPSQPLNSICRKVQATELTKNLIDTSTYVLNDMDRFHLVCDVIDRVPGLAEPAATVRQAMVDNARSTNVTSMNMALISQLQTGHLLRQIF